MTDPPATSRDDTLSRDNTLAEIERQNKESKKRRAQSLPDTDLQAMLHSEADLLAQDLQSDEKVLLLLAKGDAKAAEAELHRRGLYHGGDNLNDYPTTDAGQGEVIAYLYADQLRYDHTQKHWLVWDEHRWKKDANGEPQRLAVMAARKRLAAAVLHNEEATKKRLVRWALDGEGDYRIRCTLNLASIQHPVAVTTDQFDRDPWMLACNNGVIDLHTGQLRPGQRADMISMSTGVDYEPGARCDRWLQFLDEVFKSDADLIGFVQRAAGYSLTGVTTEQCLFICYGKGENGKSVFWNTLHAFTGEYAKNTGFSTFLDNRAIGREIPDDVADLCGARLVTASEINEGKRFNEGRIKSLTGGDRITARKLYKDFFTFIPTFKLWMAVNHKPIIKGTDQAIWRRIRLIPFTATFPSDIADPYLIDKLKLEASGILSWAVQGCLDWQHYGLGEAKAIKAATGTYRVESDILASFLADRTIQDPNTSVRAGEIYGAYKSWCEANGEYSITGSAFGRQLGERGLDKYHDRNGWYYTGIGLTSVL